MKETELKFQIPPGRRRAVDTAVAGEPPARRVRLQAAYCDTAERALARAGLALRVRREGRRWVQTLKGPGDDGLTRFEHNVPRPALPGHEPAVDPALHAGTPPGDRLRELLAGQPADALGVVFGTDIQRRTRVLSAPGGVVELAFDEGRIVAGESSLPVCELEIELKDGVAQAVIDTAADWVARHGLWLDTRTKAERGDLLARGEPIAPARTARPLRLDADLSPAAARREVLRGCTEQIAVNASQVAAGEYRDEHVHQLRVGLRRLRTALRLFDGLAADDAARADAAAALFRRLGDARDEVVIEGEFAPALRQAREHAVGEAQPAVDAAQIDVQLAIDAVREPLSQRLLLDLLAAGLEPESESGETAAPPKPARLRPFLAKRLDRWHRQVVAGAQRYERLDDEARHTLRKRVKRLRYAVEFAQGVFDGRAVKRYLKPLRALQERLGAVNDVVMAMETFRAARESDPQAWFALGWLEARRVRLVDRARPDLKAFAKAKRFWKR